MSSQHRPFFGAAAVVLAWSAFLCGCDRPREVHPAHQTVKAPQETISVYQLAGRLNLRVVRNDHSVALLQRYPNSVTIFPDPAGAVFVNGAQLPVSGRIVLADSMIFVPESLEWLIREAMRPEPPPPPAPPPTAPKPRLPPAVVVLDPGHGGRDPGAIGCNGMFEKDVVLPVGLMVRELLQQRNVKVVMTREQDQFVELERRAEIANRAEASLLVAIHADSSRDAALRGHTLYVAQGARPESVACANSADRHLAATGNHSCGVRSANYRVLVRSTCPSVLVEIGYLSNRLDAQRLATEQHRRAVAAAIAAAIAERVGR